ncbi:LacI family DNA-binding transcriptional regulator [Bifidobacterium callimiconis]|nr:LacI family DNA-binding transcriptional regulator [Bifidobacterium callimiconis]
MTTRAIDPEAGGDGRGDDRDGFGTVFGNGRGGDASDRQSGRAAGRGNGAPATLSDVAREAGVSIATASRVLNGGTRKVRDDLRGKVMQAAERLNYHANAYAQAVAKGGSSNIALLVSDISDPYFAGVSQGVVKAASQRGVTVSIAVASNGEDELDRVRGLVATRPRGIIISESENVNDSARQELQEELERYRSSGGRVVFILDRGLPFPAVDVANEAGGRAIGRLLVESGYRRPVILKGNDGYRSSAQRYRGVVGALAEAGIMVDPRAVANGQFNRTKGFSAIMQMAGAGGMLTPGEGAVYGGAGADSIVALNDVMAIGAMTALRNAGIVPGRDIGVTGFGDIPYAVDVHPALTTVHLPLTDMGRAAVESVLSDDEYVADDSGRRLIFLQGRPDVILRDSLPRR